MREVHLVTGAAGFIGSHVADALLARGELVRGVDCFTPYYDRRSKEGNIAHLLENPNFELRNVDLREGELPELLEDVGFVYHLAAQPGVPRSWASGFADYVTCNVVGTQRLLEAVRDVELKRFVYASSGSTYGDIDADPITEEDLPRPHSPYGVTKLAAEHLCSLYADEWDVPVVSLRYFYVYGPRQRPDVAVYRMIENGIRGEPFELWGDGSHARDFTYVADIVEATLLAAEANEIAPGTFINVSTGSVLTLSELIEIVGRAIGKPLTVERLGGRPGYTRGARGSNRLAHELLHWEPRTSVEDGIAEQVAWHRQRMAAEDGGRASRAAARR